MPARHEVESYRFWDIVKLWAREELEAEDVIARALAKAIVRDGLRANSTDLRWIKSKAASIALDGHPYVGFCAKPGIDPCVLRAEALEHLLRVVRDAKRPSRKLLADEFIYREDFRNWLRKSRHPLPAFWFGKSEQTAS